MPINQHAQDNDDSTNRIIILCVFSTIVISIAMMIVAHFLEGFIRWHTQDLEACYHATLTEEEHVPYGTFSPTRQEELLQEAENRRFQIREQVRDHISGVYQISVRRLDENEVSSSSESLASTVESWGGSGSGGSEQESSMSESESESSDESEGENGWDM